MPRIYEVNKITHGKGKGRFSAPDISSEDLDVNTTLPFPVNTLKALSLSLR